jgi:structural maintenance of chromosome 2
LNRSVADLDAKKARITEIEETITRTKTEITNLEEDIKDVTLRREKEMRKGGKYEALEKSVKEASHEVVRLKTLIDLKRGSIEEETRRKDKALQSLQELEKACDTKRKEFEKVQTAYQKLRAEFDEQQNEAVKKEELLQTLSTGIAAKEGQDNGYMDQLQGMNLKYCLDFRCEVTCNSSCYRARTSKTQNERSRNPNLKRGTSRQESCRSK